MKAKIVNNRHFLFKCGIVIMIIIVGFGLYNTIDQILKHTTIDHVSAENFACSDANLQTDDVLVLNNDFVKEKGKYVYRISFVHNNDQYDYIINGIDGSVISKNQTISEITYIKEKKNTEKKINISIAEAKNIASDYYEIKNKDNLIYTKAKLDDEKDLVYSIIMNDNEKEYYTEVSATNGSILSFQIKEKEIKNNTISQNTNTTPKTNNSNTKSSNTNNVVTPSNNNTNTTSLAPIVKEETVTTTPIVTPPTPPATNQKEDNYYEVDDDIDEDDDYEDYDEDDIDKEDEDEDEEDD